MELARSLSLPRSAAFLTVQNVPVPCSKPGKKTNNKEKEVKLLD